MSHVQPIRPLGALIHLLNADDRQFLNIAGFQFEDGHYVSISSYGDSTWNFTSYLQRSNASKNAALIDFDYILPDGISLRHPHHVSLLESVKAYLYVRWVQRGQASKIFISAATLVGEWSTIKPLLAWMTENGITCFKNMSPVQCMRYALHIKDKVSREGLSTRTGAKSLDIVYKFFEFRDFLEDALPEHPWPEQSSLLLMGMSRRQGYRDATTEIIPRRLYIKLGKSSLDFIEQRAEEILVIFDEFMSLRNKASQSAHHYLDLRFNRKLKNQKPADYDQLQKEISDRVRTLFEPFRKKHKLGSIKQYFSELTLLRSCCYVVCAQFSGMRDSELCSLKTGSFYRSLGFDNEEYCWLSGTTFKLEADPKPARWMVPEIVENAVKIAARLASPLNDLLEIELHHLKGLPRDDATPDANRARAIRIIELSKLRNNLFADWLGPAMGPRSLDNGTSNSSMKALVQHFDLVVEQEDLDEIRDRKRIRPGELWPLATHQFRRSFAIFVARNMLGDVRYLRHHFKHWSIDMTLYYASDPLFDDSLLESTLTARDQLQATVFSNWLSGDQPLAGGRGPDIIQFRQRGSVKTAKDPIALAKSVGDGVFIRGTGHSWCLATTSGCGGEGLYDAIRCVRCSESVIDQSHIGIWSEIRKQQIEALDWPDMGVPAKERAKTHIREAENVLEHLGQTIAPHQFESLVDGD